MRKILRAARDKTYEQVRRLERRILPHSRILLYHRIAEVREDPHLLAIAPALFREHLKYLSETYRILHLDALMEHYSNGTLSDRDIALTFDDGYADNLHNALPLLEEFGAPATIFVTAGMVGKEEPFYWDAQTSPSARGRALTYEELLQLGRHPLITIGAHTMTHPRLSSLSPKMQQEEVTKSKHLLEAWLGEEVRHFAYPFGSASTFTAKTQEEVRDAGFAFGYTTLPRALFHRTNRFGIPRLNVRSWNARELASRIQSA